jgi:hypothetical protein
MKMLSTELGSAELARLLGVTPRAVTDLKVSRKLEPSVDGYCEYLRTMASGRGGEAGVLARERLGQAQADLAEAKAAQARGCRWQRSSNFSAARRRRSAIACSPSRRVCAISLHGERP